jgi:hypothetical protein
LAALLFASPALGQLSVDRSADPLDAGQRVNAFVRWGGAEPVEGVEIEVPAGWAVRSVDAIRSGTAVPVSLNVAGEVGEVEATASQPLRGVQTFVVGLEAGPSLGYQTVRIAPILAGRPQPSGAAEWQVYVHEAMSTGRNRAFQLEAGAEPVALRRRALPSLDPRDPLTLEVWLKTVGLGEVVLSTWDGNEDRPYPVEVVVDGRGRLVFYRGRPGQHEAMTSKEPVADGRWHHVAVVNDPFAGWARLFVDGLPVDSLRSEEAAGTLNTMSLALGGRPERPGAPQSRLFSGQLDELRLWNVARPAVTLRRTMRVPLDVVPDGVFRLGFDEPIPPDVLVAAPEARVRVPSSLSFVFPVESLEASVEQGIVTLTWATKDRRADEFRVERSTDGQRFEGVGTVRAAERVGETADGSARFAYTDLPPDGQVLYYRIRQSAVGGAERVSGTLKLGLGEGEGSAVAIVGNSPNPFRGSTVVTYDLAAPTPVRLSVWDISGTRVAVLLDETMPAGRHEYRFAADGLPSGVYFVRLETPEGSAAHKMTLTR